MFKPDPTAKVVFYTIKKDLSAGVLDNYPHPTPVFEILRIPCEDGTQWRVEIKFDIGFTDAMTSRSDVLHFMLRAPAFLDTTSASTVRASVSKLLMHWAEAFPDGVPDSAL